MTAIRPKKLSVATRIRRALKRGLSPSEVAKATGASVSYVYTIQSRMQEELRRKNPAPEPTPTPEIVKLEVPLIPFVPIPQGIAGLHEVKEEPAQPVAAHAASEIVEAVVEEKPDNHLYLWLVALVVVLTLLFMWYFTRG